MKLLSIVIYSCNGTTLSSMIWDPRYILHLRTLLPKDPRDWRYLHTIFISSQVVIISHLFSCLGGWLYAPSGHIFPSPKFLSFHCHWWIVLNSHLWLYICHFSPNVYTSTICTNYHIFSRSFATAYIWMSQGCLQSSRN